MWYADFARDGTGIYYMRRSAAALLKTRVTVPQYVIFDHEPPMQAKYMAFSLVLMLQDGTFVWQKNRTGIPKNQELSQQEEIELFRRIKRSQLWSELAKK